MGRSEDVVHTSYFGTYTGSVTFIFVSYDATPESQVPADKLPELLGKLGENLKQLERETNTSMSVGKEVSRDAPREVRAGGHCVGGPAGVGGVECASEWFESDQQ